MVKNKNIILVIDDEKDLLEMIQYQFHARGFEVMTAENGVEGLEKLKEKKPDLIILDINMPKMGGIEFYKNVCDSEGRPKYHILVLTARANMEQLFREFDIDGFIAKPFDIDQIIKEGEMIIKKAKRFDIKVGEQFSSGPKTVFIVENDPDAFNKISISFLDADYKVVSAKSGTSAIEKMMYAPPGLALINLRLPDISGEVVAFRLRRIFKTTEVKMVLYTIKGDKYNKNNIAALGYRHGITMPDIIEYSDPQELIDVVDKVFQK